MVPHRILGYSRVYRNGYITVFLCYILTVTVCLSHDVNDDLYAPAITQCRRCPIIGSSGLDDCWDNMLDHFTEHLEISMNRYALALQYVTRWKSYHHDKADRYTNYTTQRYNDVLDKLYPDDENADDTEKPLNKEDLSEIFKVILEKNSGHDEVYADEEWPMPTLQCPVPCNYEGETWRTLFIITAIALVLVLILLAAHVCWRSNRSDSHILLVNNTT